MHEYTASDSLRKHMLSVEAAMRAYAEHFGEDPERWGLAGLIHDFDYERFPNAAHSPTEEHPSEGVRRLRERGWPEDILQAILGHAAYTNVARETRMARTLSAVDELTGLITATALVKPSKSIHDVDARSVRKKMKDKAFAKTVSREDITSGADVAVADSVGIDADQCEAMKAIAPAFQIGDHLRRERIGIDPPAVELYITFILHDRACAPDRVRRSPPRSRRTPHAR